jgi:hypothetical protein
LKNAKRLPRFRQSRGSVGTNTYNLKLFYGRFHGPLARRKLLYGCFRRFFERLKEATQSFTSKPPVVSSLKLRLKFKFQSRRKPNTYLRIETKITSQSETD